MTIISYRPSDDQFWIACNLEEAEKWFVPHLDERQLEQYHMILQQKQERKERNPESVAEYDKMIMDTMQVNEVAYAYFNVSRDLSVCYSDVAHHPFHQLWNAYSPFCRCDFVEINSPEDLKDIVITYKGKPYQIGSNEV